VNRSLLQWLVTIAVAAAALSTLAAFGKLRDVAVFVGLAAKHREERIFWCPMHPFYKVKKYGICPYCNMELEPYAAGPGSREQEGTLVLTPQQIQQAGVRVEKVAKRDLAHEIETTAIAEINHERYWHIEFRFEGWVEELYIHNVGEPVEKGAPVARVYSPVLFASQKEYLIALASKDQTLVDSSKRRLELLGVDPEEIRALEERNEPSARLILRSRYTGTLMHLNVKAGMKVPDDGHVADLADLRTLWAFADVYERDVAHVKVGQEVRLSTGERTVQGKIDLVEPRVKVETQSARVRMRIDNDPATLRPGQFARALILTRLPQTLSVSEHAVIPTGRRDLVILALGGGRFTAREVTVGRRWLTEVDARKDARGLGFFTGHNRFHEVKAGLTDGEEVVTSGAFLLHAETQIRNLIDKMVPEVKPATSTRSAWTGAKTEKPHEMDGLPFADHAEAALYAKEPGKSWHARAPKLRAAAAAVLDRYFLLNNAIADGKKELAAEYAEGVAGEADALEKLVSEPLDETVAGPLRRFAGSMKEAAHAAHDAPALKDTMKHFGAMSAAIEEYVAEFGRPTEKPLFQFYCGMAQKTVGSPTERWFQPDAELRNPFGMPGCGGVEKEHR